MKERIKQIIKNNLSDLIQMRRHIHQNPELSFAEHETMAYISSKLNDKNISHRAGIANTGIVGHLGNNELNCVALRADIDALPMFEKTNAPYASKNEGIMHACGHDVHTTCLYGALLALQEIEPQLAGTVKFLFQPAEEKLPGGAQDMIAAGVLDDAPVPQAILGLHVHPPLDVGKLGFRGGMFMASADEITIDIIGKGGHAAMPREFVDPIIAAATFLVQVQQVVSRKSDPAIPTVVSFGKIETPGGSFNIIPERVRLSGTLRTMNEEWRDEALSLITELAHAVAKSLGCEAEVALIKGYPCLVNDELLTAKTKQYAQELVGDDKVVDLAFRMGAEDFARYTQQIPGVFFRLGIRNESKGITANLHSPYFDVDEESILHGASAMAWLAYSYLNDQKIAN